MFASRIYGHEEDGVYGEKQDVIDNILQVKLRV
jgi:hypothetical protein